MRYQVRVLGMATGLLVALAACSSGPALSTAPAPSPSATRTQTLAAADTALEGLLAAALGQGMSSGRAVELSLSAPPSDTVPATCEAGHGHDSVTALVTRPDDHGQDVRAYLLAHGWTLTPWRNRPDVLPGMREFTGTRRGAQVLVDDRRQGAGTMIMAIGVTPCLVGKTMQGIAFPTAPAFAPS